MCGWRESPRCLPASTRDRAYPQRPVQLIPSSSDTAYLHSAQVAHLMRLTNALPFSDGSMPPGPEPAPCPAGRSQASASRCGAYRQPSPASRNRPPAGRSCHSPSDPMRECSANWERSRSTGLWRRASVQNPKASRWERRASIGATPVRHVPCGSIIRPMLLHGTTDTLAPSPARAFARSIRHCMPARYSLPLLGEEPALSRASGEA